MFFIQGLHVTVRSDRIAFRRHPRCRANGDADNLFLYSKSTSMLLTTIVETGIILASEISFVDVSYFNFTEYTPKPCPQKLYRLMCNGWKSLHILTSPTATNAASVPPGVRWRSKWMSFPVQSCAWCKWAMSLMRRNRPPCGSVSPV